MSRHALRLMMAIVLLAAASWVTAQNEPTIASTREALKSALDQKDAKGVWQAAHKILGLAAKQDLAKMSPMDQYAVGVAHYYLVGEAMELALASGNLDDEHRKLARQLRNEIMAATRDPGDRLQIISHGQQIDLSKYIAAGKTTIVDFFSEYCGPCRQFAPTLEQLACDREDIQVIKVDINRPNVEGIDWQSPVAQQFKLESIPAVFIFGPDRQLQKQGEEAMQQVMDWAEE